MVVAAVSRARMRLRAARVAAAIAVSSPRNTVAADLDLSRQRALQRIRAASQPAPPEAEAARQRAEIRARERIRERAHAVALDLLANERVQRPGRGRAVTAHRHVTDGDASGVGKVPDKRSVSTEGGQESRTSIVEMTPDQARAAMRVQERRRRDQAAARNAAERETAASREERSELRRAREERARKERASIYQLNANLRDQETAAFQTFAIAMSKRLLLDTRADDSSSDDPGRGEDSLGVSTPEIMSAEQKGERRLAAEKRTCPVCKARLSSPWLLELHRSVECRASRSCDQ